MARRMATRNHPSSAQEAFIEEDYPLLQFEEEEDTVERHQLT